MTVGERIRERRKKLGLSADQLGKLLGKNRATIYRYESDDIENMSIAIIPPLAEALKCSPAYLMGWTEFDVYSYIDEGSPEHQSLELAKKIVNMSSDNQKIMIELIEKLSGK